ncbi:flagellar hook assembly protein FlgD [Chitinilyticum piscinae]|uniref:Basal-body rod modification protein FlgD n=1 Tax=Chitinilyticum piscinae TaxID=2866724 RepID=A0A8J7FNQ0_9NEIS|nr:flagellar hook assembly protein FlgD [Chitinilyticum piscinae]MBE9610770.1 flagellar hook assembly protein FlgD [Chitinilyticum piscinae]
MAVSSVSNKFDYTTLNTDSGKSRSEVEEQQDRFLKMLVTQLQNQDPMNPMDNAQTTSQMAQINTVTGIEKLNKTMETMMSLYAGTQVMQSAQLIGKDVLAPGKDFHFDGKQADFSFDVPEGVKSAEVKITDAKGNVVAVLPYSAPQSGVKPVVWDGKLENGTTAPAGDYKVSVKAQDQNGKEIALNSYTWQSVKSVQFGSEGVVALMSNGNRVSFGSILEIQAGSKV